MRKCLKRLIFLMVCIFGTACTTLDDLNSKIHKIVVTAGKGELNAALEAARVELKNGHSVEIILSDGIYFLERPILLTGEYSGNEDNPFIIRAQNPRAAILSGAKPVTLQWSSFAPGILVADLEAEAFDAFFVNGKKQVRARYPNFSDEKKTFGGYAADTLDTKRTAHWRTPQTGYFHAMHSGRWGGWHYNIAGRHANGSIKLGNRAGNNRPSEPHQKYQYVENIFEELDAPGEWFFDEEQKKIYFYPPAHIDLGASTFAVSHLENLIEIRGTPQKPAKHIELLGLSFINTASTFMQTTEPLLRSDWMIARKAAVFVEGAENAFVRQSNFEQLGGNAVFFSGYNRASGAVANKIHNIGAGGINVIGYADAVRSPSFTYMEYAPLDELDTEAGPRSNNFPQDTVVENNLIFNIGTIEKQVAGVQIAMSARTTVRANSIYDVPRAGINIGDGAWGGHHIEFNDVFNTVLETGDHGAFNSWGRDRFWHPNRETMNRLAKEYPQIIFLDAVEPTVIANNRFQSDHGWDIDLDDGSSNYIIKNNVCLSGGLKLREGFKRIVTNNVLINNSFHPHVWFENSLDVFRHNIVMTDYKPILVEHWGNNIDQNFFPTKSALKKSQDLGNDSNSLYGDPLFKNAEAGDFRVDEKSGALRVGFHNFPVAFGVQVNWLKAQARKPAMPDLFIHTSTESTQKVRHFFGAKVRSVLTEGDKSAFGLLNVSGVIVAEVEANSVAERAGLQARDVILETFNESNNDRVEISNVEALLSSTQERKWLEKLGFVVLRNQTRHKITLELID